jgi:hypothetical protein
VKTLRAFLWGSALGALVGLILAPQRDTIANAQLVEDRDRAARATGTPAASGHAVSGQRAQPGMREEMGTRTAPTRGAVSGQYVGNLHTKVYHDATDATLPPDEHRTYFATPEEAEAAGYRAAE